MAHGANWVALSWKNGRESVQNDVNVAVGSWKLPYKLPLFFAFAILPCRDRSVALDLPQLLLLKVARHLPPKAGPMRVGTRLGTAQAMTQRCESGRARASVHRAHLRLCGPCLQHTICTNMGCCELPVASHTSPLHPWLLPSHEGEQR